MRRYAIYGIMFMMLSIIIDVQFSVLFIAILYLNAKLESFQFKIGVPTRIEIAHLGTILMTMLYGLWLGIFVGLLSRTLNAIIMKDLRREHLFMTFTYVLSAIITYYAPLGFITLGVLLTIINTLLMVLFRKYVLQLENYILLSRTLSNFTFNMLIFVSGSAHFFYTLLAVS